MSAQRRFEGVDHGIGEAMRFCNQRNVSPPRSCEGWAGIGPSLWARGGYAAQACPLKR